MLPSPDQTAPPTEYLTTGQVAKRLGLHERTIRRAIGRGELAAIEFGSSAGYRITEEALAAWLESRRARPTEVA